MATATKEKVNRKLKERLAHRQLTIEASDYDQLSPELQPIEHSEAIVRRNRETTASGNSKKKLTKKQERRLEELLLAMSTRDRILLLGTMDVKKGKIQVAREAGYSHTTSLNSKGVVEKALRRNEEAFELLLCKAGISMDAIAAKYAELFNCKVPFVINKKEGNYIMTPDNRNQLATLELIHKMRGELDQRHTVEVSGRITHEHEHLIAERAKKRLQKWDEDEESEVIDVEAEVVI